MEKTLVLNLAIKAAITLGYFVTMACLFIAIQFIQEGREYTQGAIQVVQLYTEAAGFIAVPLLVTKCLEGIFRYSVSALKDWQSSENGG